MKNKVISLSLAVIMTLSSIHADSLVLQQSSTTGPDEWTDPASGMTYQNFGSVNFKFKKNVTSFTPWLKARAPSVTAGCGGVSLDAGFAAFLDLETIGKQLEQATSSVGMGVIVVLLQTMPSIAKAFENVQKLIRKIQGMLANACQSTVSLLSKNKNIQRAQSSMQDAVDDKLGMDSFNTKLEGITAKMDVEKTLMNCSTSDASCKAFKSFMGINASSSKDAQSAGSNTASGVPSEVANNTITQYSLSDSNKVYADTITNMLNNGKFDSKDVMSVEERQKQKLVFGIFGILAVPYSQGTINIAGLTNGVGKIDSATSTGNESDAKEVSKATRGLLALPSYIVEYVPSVNTTDEVVNFLTGKGLAIGTSNHLKIPSDFTYKAIIKSTEAKITSGAQGSVIGDMYLEKNKNYNPSDTFNFDFEGIETATYKTILNLLDSSTYSAPAVPIGVYMPKGSTYVESIRKYADKKDYAKYANLLAKMNVRYAMEALMYEARVMAIGMANIKKIPANKIALDKYTQAIIQKTKDVMKKIDDYSGDVEYLNALDQIFIQMKKESREKRLENAKGV